MATKDWCYAFHPGTTPPPVEALLRMVGRRCMRTGVTMRGDFTRCPHTDDLQVHYLPDSLLWGDCNLEILCPLHHLQEHLAVPACRHCGKPVLDPAEGLLEYLADHLRRNPGCTPADIGWDWLKHYPYCSPCGHLLAKDV